MWHYLKIVQLAVSMIPLLIEAIKAVEAAVPGQGRGEQKLALIRELLESAHRTTQGMDVAFAELWPVLQALIDRLVATYNADGTLARRTVPSK